jgi:hypothetical protein
MVCKWRTDGVVTRYGRYIAESCREKELFQRRQQPQRWDETGEQTENRRRNEAVCEESGDSPHIFFCETTEPWKMGCSWRTDGVGTRYGRYITESFCFLNVMVFTIFFLSNTAHCVLQCVTFVTSKTTKVI